MSTSSNIVKMGVDQYKVLNASSWMPYLWKNLSEFSFCLDVRIVYESLSKTGRHLIPLSAK